MRLKGVWGISPNNRAARKILFSKNKNHIQISFPTYVGNVLGPGACPRRGVEGARSPLTRGQRHTARRKAPPDPPWAGAAGRITGLFDDQREYLNQEKYIGNSENYTVEPVQNPAVARDYLPEILDMAAALNQREA